MSRRREIWHSLLILVCSIAGGGCGGDLVQPTEYVSELQLPDPGPFKLEEKVAQELCVAGGPSNRFVGLQNLSAVTRGKLVKTLELKRPQYFELLELEYGTVEHPTMVRIACAMPQGAQSDVIMQELASLESRRVYGGSRMSLTRINRDHFSSLKVAFVERHRLSSGKTDTVTIQKPLNLRGQVSPLKHVQDTRKKIRANTILSNTQASKVGSTASLSSHIILPVWEINATFIYSLGNVSMMYGDDALSLKLDLDTNSEDCARIEALQNSANNILADLYENQTRYTRRSLQ